MVIKKLESYSDDHDHQYEELEDKFLSYTNNMEEKLSKLKREKDRLKTDLQNCHQKYDEISYSLSSKVND